MRLTSRLGALDGLRTVSVLLVFATHSVTDLVPGGFIGVDVFFVLSGFLITGLLVAEWERTGRVQLTAFYARRALRLYPALVLTLVLVALVTPWVGSDPAALTRDSLTSLTYTYNLYRVVLPDLPSGPVGHFWSLCVEEQYYVVWPLVLLWLLRRGGTETAIRGTVVGIVATAVVKAALVPLLTTGRLYFLPLGHADELLVGSLLGLVLVCRDTSALHRVATTPWVWLCPLPLLVVALTTDIQAAWLYLGGLLVLAATTGLVVAHLVLRPRSAMARLLSLPPLRWLGVRSYAFYLVHQPVIAVLREQGLPYRVVVPAALALSCLLCAASWPVERAVARRYRHRFESPAGPTVGSPEPRTG